MKRIRKRKEGEEEEKEQSHLEPVGDGGVCGPELAVPGRVGGAQLARPLLDCLLFSLIVG